MYTDWTTHNRWKIWSKDSNHENANGWDTRSWPSVPMQYREPVSRYELESIHITRPCLLKIKRVLKWLIVIRWIQLDFARCSAIHACLSRVGSATAFALFWCELGFLDKTVVVEDLILKISNRKHTCLTRSHKSNQSANINALTIFWNVMPRCRCQKGIASIVQDQHINRLLERFEVTFSMYFNQKRKNDQSPFLCYSNNDSKTDD